MHSDQDCWPAFRGGPLSIFVPLQCHLAGTSERPVGFEPQVQPGSPSESPTSPQSRFLSLLPVWTMRVWAPSGHCHTTPHAGTSAFTSHVLGAGRLPSGTHMVGSGESRLQVPFSLCPHMVEGTWGGEASCVRHYSQKEGFTLRTEPPPEAPTPNTIILGVGV